MALGFRDRVTLKFRVRVRVWVWSGVTLCPCTFCSDHRQLAVVINAKTNPNPNCAIINKNT